MLEIRIAKQKISIKIFNNKAKLKKKHDYQWKTILLFEIKLKNEEYQ
jgi:hypothetical protein